jgi:cytoskeletal protein CcmA (bactofilin family)
MASHIGKALTVTGTIEAAEPLAIAGTVHGDVFVTDHEVTLHPGAKVTGAVLAHTIVVHGHAQGRLVARDIVRIEREASVAANVAAPRFELIEGAEFEGRVEPDRTDAAFRVADYRRNEPGRAERPDGPTPHRRSDEK